MKDRIKGLTKINWRNLKPIQPEDVKIQNNLEALKKSLKKHGFSLPFAVWKEGKQVYTIDGHTRVKALKELMNEGIEVPETLPAFEIEAKNRKEAIEILVEVFNQKHNPFDHDILVEWLEAEEIEVEELEAVNIGIKLHDEDFDIDDFFEDETNDKTTDQYSIILYYTEDDYNRIIKAFEKYPGTREEIIFTLLEA